MPAPPWVTGRGGGAERWSWARAAVYGSPVLRIRARTSLLKLRCRVTADHLLDRRRPPPSGGHTANEMTRAARESVSLRLVGSRLGRNRSRLGADRRLA